MAQTVSLAETRSRLSELVGRASEFRERFLVMHRGKPVAAIVSVDDLAALEARERTPARRGILAAVGALAEFDEWGNIMDEVARRERG